MASQKVMSRATALVLRTVDFSETSRIATLWTRELGKVRVLAKGGRRLRSSFDSALDLLTVCDIVLLRKSSGSLDLLTEAQVVQRFGRLREDLTALYTAYYVAELLADWTEELDPHPDLFDQALDTLVALNQNSADCGLEVMRFEMGFLVELGYRPVLGRCTECSGGVQSDALAFSAISGGVLCPRCRPAHRDARPLSAAGREFLMALGVGEGAGSTASPEIRSEVRRLLSGYVTVLRGRPPRLLPYLGS